MSSLKSSVLIVFALLCSFITQAQYRSEKFRIAEKLEFENKYIEAIDAYNEAYVENESLVEIVYKLASLNEKYGALKSAEKWYSLLIEKHSDKYPQANFNLAVIYQKTGRYQQAIELFEQFSKDYKEFDRIEMNKIVKAKIAGCEASIAAKPDTSFSYRPLNKINSIYTDLSPIVHNKELIFSSILSDSVLTYSDEEGQEQFMQLWSANYDEKTDSLADSLKLFGPPSWYQKNKNIGGGAFSTDGKRFYFTRCELDLSRNNRCKIYGASKTDTGWTSAIEIKGDVNDEANIYSSTHPTLSYYEKRGKKRDVLYFSSNRPDGKGGYDLWETELDLNFNAGKAKNLGNKINTSLNEITPHFNEEEQTLYFSSNGLEGFGGLDVFKAEKNRSRFKNPEQLSAPFNSSLDDFFYFKINEFKALLVSNREGAKNYYKSFVLDDIFLFTKHKPIEKYFYVSCFKQDSVLILLDSVQLTVQYQNAPKTSIAADSLTLALLDSSCTITATKEGYFSSSKRTAFTKENSDTTAIYLVLEKVVQEKEIRLKNIYFDFDSDVLTDSSKLELDSLLLILADNPYFKIEIGAHTDNKGKAAYNLKLSQKRAESVVNYLLTKGISKERLVAKGYGMTKPIAENKNPDGSDNPEGRQLNRRIVFKIIGEIERTKEEPVIDSISIQQAEDTIDVTVNLSELEKEEWTKKDSTSSLPDSINSTIKDQLKGSKTTVKPDTISQQQSSNSSLIHEEIERENDDTEQELENDEPVPASSSNFTSFPVDASVTKNRFRWLKSAAAQKIVCQTSINIQQLRVLVKKKTGATFKIVVVRAKNGKVIFESEEQNIEAEKASSARDVDSLDIVINANLPADTYFIFPIISSGELAYLGNYTHQNNFKEGTIIIGEAMYTNFSSNPEKYKFKLKEEKTGRMTDYGPFFKIIFDLK